jgi:hypothetical protein
VCCAWSLARLHLLKCEVGGGGRRKRDHAEAGPRDSGAGDGAEGLEGEPKPCVVDPRSQPRHHQAMARWGAPAAAAAAAAVAEAHAAACGGISDQDAFISIIFFLPAPIAEVIEAVGCGEDTQRRG